MPDYLVRVGVLGQIGRFQAVEASQHTRGRRVVCRTNRGLEFGSVLNRLQHSSGGLARTGTILRLATSEDHLLWARIEKNRNAAFAECQQLLNERGTGTSLLDVELLFDGKSLFFYFLGEIDSEVESMTETLAAAYETKAQLRQFAETLAEGCGPDCGTKDGGCGDGGCGSCAIAKVCSTQRAPAT